MMMMVVSQSTRDVQGNVTYFVYDSSNRRVRTVQNYVSNGEAPSLWKWTTDKWTKNDGTTPIAHGDDHDENQISITEYDVAGRVQSTTDVRNNQTYYVYDGLGRRIRTIQNYVAQGSTDPADWVWDDLESTPRWEDGADNAIGHGTTDIYDENVISDTTYSKDGRVISTRSHNGNETQFVYDDAGRRIRTIQNYVARGSTDPADWVWDTNQWEDGAGNAIHITDFDENLITDTTYNKSGQVVSTRDMRGTQTTFSYDLSGRRVSVTQAANTSLASTNYTCYDKQGRVLRTIANWIDDGTDPDAVDGGGDWVFNPTAHGANNDQNLITEYDYDKANRRTQVTNANGDANQTSYFVNGLVDTVTDLLGTATAYRYDNLRRRKRVVQNHVAPTSGEDPTDWVWDGPPDDQWEESGGTAIIHGTNNDENIIVDVSYDTLGRMTQMRNPRGYETSYDYDKLGRRIKTDQSLD